MEFLISIGAMCANEAQDTNSIYLYTLINWTHRKTIVILWQMRLELWSSITIKLVLSHSFQSCWLPSERGHVTKGETASRSYPKMWNSAFQEVWLGLKVCIKDGHKFIILHIITLHCWLHVASLVACAICPVSVYDVNSLLVPLIHFSFNQLLGLLVRRIIQYLDQYTLLRPIQLTNSWYRLLINLHMRQPEHQPSATQNNLPIGLR